jgi:tetratricopeptide (TPR) repeat protein
MLQAAMPGAGVVAPTEGTWKFYWDVGLATRYRALADANYNLKNYAEAERAVRQAIVYQARLPEQTLERKREAAQNQVLLALILARLDRRPEAQQAVAPALKLHRELQVRNGDDLALRIELARTLYAAALAGVGKETALLTEAAALIDGLPPSLRNLKSASLTRREIAVEQARRHA